MRKSKRSTGSILIKAQVCSEWDSCNACIVEFTAETLNRLGNYDSVATGLKRKDTDFYCLSLWEFSDFINLKRDDVVPDSWIYVTFKDDFKKERPEQNIDAHQMKFYGEGIVCFTGYGEHTSEEFWSDSININNLTVSI